EERDPFLTGVLTQLEPCRRRKLERLAMLTIGGAEGVLVVVRRVVERARVQAPVVALLELDRIDAALTRCADQRLGLLDVALMVVADLRDDVCGTILRDPPAVDDERGHVAMVLAKPEEDDAVDAFAREPQAGNRL